MERITLVVIDDHPLFRQGVIDALSLEPDIWVVGQAENGEDGLDLLRRVRPLVAIVDVNLPGINGHQVLRSATMLKLPTRIVLLTAYDDTSQHIYSLRSGVWAYCTKDIQPENLIEVLRKVAAGMHIIRGFEYDELAMVRWLDAQDKRIGAGASSTQEGRKPLSAREMEVLSYLARGLSNKEIAVSLGISHQTVKNHVTAILQKLDVTDRTQAAIYAVQQGWVKIYGSD
jgi:DNA-binding NarL/FixJ family response regulator